MKKLLALVVALVLVMSLATVASAADYPTKGISVICPWGAGGGTDACLRAFCLALEKQLGVTLTVDNLTGAGGVIGHEAIADADPDGYTMGMVTFELSAYLAQEMSDYTYENYIPLCRVNIDAAAITVNTEWANANNITDVATFVEYAKAHPGEVMMGGSSSGSVWHIAGGYLMNATGTDIKMITYANGAADAVKAAAQGEIQGVTVSLAEAKSFIGNGLTVLGVMDTVRSAVYPEVPTCQEQGVEAVYYTQRGMALPLGVDEEIKATLKAACEAAIQDPDFVEFMNNNGQTIAWMTAEEYTEWLAGEEATIREIMTEFEMI
jgi:tripartite-type tricarboxylate transporter receptor subunit TctC